jgi:hypothetical protein
MTKRAAKQLYWHLEQFERQTRAPGRQDGAIGRNGLAVVRALLFKFMNWKTGRLDPSQAKIADAAAISESSVERGLAALKAAGVVNWLRRCVADVQSAGGFLMRQISNAYAVLPSTQWKGYKAAEGMKGLDAPSATQPEPGTWGDQPPSDPYAEAKAANDLVGRLAALEAEGALGSGVAGVHARFVRRLLYGPNSLEFGETVRLTKKPDPIVSSSYVGPKMNGPYVSK